jgi:glycosyltransferase involved in cell wall biosynthesis
MSLKNKKIAIIGSVGLPANYGGFETLTSHLVSNLGNQYDFTVYCSAKKYKKSDRLKKYKGARLQYLPFNANGIQSIIYDSVSILHALFYADVMIILGVAGAWLLPFVKLFTKKRIIISIDGIEWKRDKWNRVAKMYLWLAESIAVKYSHIDISDNESIQDYTAMRYGSLSRIVEYGGDHVQVVETTEEDHKKYSFLKHLYAVKVCRIEPENNVHLVLEAFSRRTNRTLVIVGNWDNSQYGRQLRKQYSNFEHIFLLDPIYNQRTLDLIRGNAILYVHGHMAGGTNPSLVEAMNLQLPILAYNVSYNLTTTEKKANYFTNAEDIYELMSNLNFDLLKLNGENMKKIADRRYQWKIIAQKYHDLITEALSVESKEQVIAKITNAARNSKIAFHQVEHLKYPHLFFEN